MSFPSYLIERIYQIRMANVNAWWKKKSLIPFNPCSSICIAGPTGSGKSFWVYRFLQNLSEMYKDVKTEKVLYCYGIWQPLFNEMEKELPFLTFHDGIPSKSDIDEFSSQNHHKLIILDDLLDEVLSSPDIKMLFIRGCHHKNLSCIFITQNLFSQNKHSRTISLNTHYLVIFKNFRDASQISFLARQIFPRKGNVLIDCYNDATNRKYGYLIVDMSPHSEDIYRLRTLVMPGEDPIVYTPKI